MPGEGCKKREHTPITTEKQRAFFRGELKRKRAGKKTRTKMSRAELIRHLKEVSKKKLPPRRKEKK